MDDSSKTPAEAKAGGGTVAEVGKARHEEVRQVPDRAEGAAGLDEASLALEPRADDKHAENQPTAEAVESSLTSQTDGDGDEADLDEAELELGPAPELPVAAPPEPGAFKPRTPQLDTANPVVARSAEPAGSLLPVPTQVPRERTSLWKRFSLKRGERRDSTEALSSQISRVEQKLAAIESLVRERTDQLEARLTQFWEIEEQLSHLNDVQVGLGEVRQRQNEILSGVRALGRGVILLAIFMAVATALGTAAMMGIMGG